MSTDAPGVAVSSGAPLRTSGPLLWFALGTVYVVWGSTYVGIRAVVETIPPLLAGGVRFLVAAGLMGAVLAMRRGPGSLRPRRRELAGSAVVGVLLLTGGNGLLMVGEQYIPAGLASLLVAAVPLWVVLFRTATRDRPAVATLAGVAIGFAGLTTLLLPGSNGHGSLGGAAIVLAASLSWATGSFLSSRLPMPRDPFVTSMYEMVVGGSLLVILGLGAGELGELSLAGVSAGSWIGLGYLVVFGSVVGFTAFAWLLGNAPISLVATYAYVNPAVAVSVAALVLGEPVTSAVLVGGGIVVAGVVLVVSTERRTARRRVLDATSPTPACEPAST